MAATYTYDQIHQLTLQAGYSGTQANAVAHYLYTNQTDSKTKNDPNEAYNSLASRIGKIALGGVLLLIGLVALLREPIEAAAGEIGKFNPAVGAVAGVSRIRQQKATRKLTEVQTARATHALQQERAASSGPLASRSPAGGTMGEQPGSEPTTGGRPVKPTKAPKVVTPRDAETIAWQRYQREQRKANPNPQAAYATWQAIATPEQVAKRQGETIKRNNQRSAGERETPRQPSVPAATQRARERLQERRKRDTLPQGRGMTEAQRKRFQEGLRRAREQGGLE